MPEVDVVPLELVVAARRRALVVQGQVPLHRPRQHWSVLHSGVVSVVVPVVLGEPPRVERVSVMRSQGALPLESLHLDYPLAKQRGQQTGILQ